MKTRNAAARRRIAGPGALLPYPPGDTVSIPTNPTSSQLHGFLLALRRAGTAPAALFYFYMRFGGARPRVASGLEFEWKLT